MVRLGSRGIAIAVLFAIGCGDDGDPSGDTGAGSAPTTTAAATDASSAGPEATSSTGEGSSTGDGDEGSSGGPQMLPMCGGANDQPMCESTFGCVWDHTPGQCVVECAIILGEQVCLDHDDCEWDGQGCSGTPM